MLRLALTAALLGVLTLPVSAQSAGAGSVFTLTNDAGDNEVQVGVRVAGRLVSFARFSTGGTGTAAGLGSQGALATTDDGRYLVAVNPGSDDVTLFRRFGRLFLSRTDLASTGGDRPTSVDVHEDLVYVLNADSDDLSGFRLTQGSLQPIGIFPLSGSGVQGAQVGFDPSGQYVIVTERATNQILVYPVQSDGGLGLPTMNASAAPTPFGFLFRDDGTLVVSEAAGGQPGLGAVSSYSIRPDGSLATISGAVLTNQTAACWIALPRNGRFAYTTNTGSGTVTGYRVDRTGALTLLDPSGVTGTLPAGAAPIDFDFNRGGTILFVLDSANDQIVAFRRDSFGGLHLLPGSLELPDGAAGLIAR